MLLLFDGLIFHQQEIEDFVQSTGEHCVVVFSLGSMVGTLTEERANMIAAGLAQIPQKVRNHASCGILTEMVTSCSGVTAETSCEIKAVTIALAHH